MDTKTYSLGNPTKNSIFRYSNMSVRKLNKALFLLLALSGLQFLPDVVAQELSDQSPADSSKSDSLDPDAETVVRVPSAMVKIADTISVPAEYAGVLTKMLVREGQLLKAGDPIGKIKDSELQLQLSQAEYENRISRITANNDVDIRFSQKSNEVAQADVSRSMRSNARVPNSVPLAKLDRQVLERDRTMLQLEQAKRDSEIARLKMNLTESEIEMSKLLIKKTDVRAPMSGMVVAVERREGEWVEPSETIVRMVKVDRLRVEGFVSAEVAAQVRIGSPVEVKFSQKWLKDHTYKGKIVFVDPEANPVNSQIIVWAEIDNHENRLLPGLRGDILIDVSASPVDTIEIGKAD